MATAARYHTKQVHYCAQKITFADYGTTVTVGKVPAGSVVTDAFAVVTTAFNYGSSSTLNLGTDGDVNGFATLLSISSKGKKSADELATSDDLYASAEDTVVAQITGTGTAPSAGVAYVFVDYRPVDDLA